MQCFLKPDKKAKLLQMLCIIFVVLINMGTKIYLGFILLMEGFHFWLGVLNDLKARGLEDIFKTVYKADTKDLAEHHLLGLDDKNGKHYPIVIKSFVVYVLHRQVRKYTKSKGEFTSENALVKLNYSACQIIFEK